LPGPGRSPLRTSPAASVLVEGVGEDADRDAAAVDPEVGAGAGGVQLGVALGDGGAARTADCPEHRGEHLADPPDPGDFAEGRQVFGLGRDGYGLVARTDVDDLRPGFAEGFNAGRGPCFEPDFG
jgi:hypothetical protein